jgi:hypothetical protein
VCSVTVNAIRMLTVSSRLHTLGAFSWCALTTVPNYIPFKNASPRTNRMLKGNYTVDLDILYTKPFVRHYLILHSDTCVSALLSHRQALKILHETIAEINAIKNNLKIIFS